MKNVITRRQFFRLGVLDFTRSILDSVVDKPAPSTKTVIRPPGAIKDEADFQEKCTRCQDCSDACPYNAILHLGPIAGSAEGTPYIDTSENPCHWCPTLDCIEACQTGALTYNADKTIDPIGKATLTLDLCLTQHGILCDDCVTSCPSSIKAIKLVNKSPQIDQKLCIGCGLCSCHCPAEPKAIKVIL